MQNSTNVNSDCRSALRQLYETTLYATDVICMHHNIEPRLPYLDHDVINAALTTPGEEKLPDKQSFRHTAIDLGLPNNVATIKRRAPQHGSNATKALDTLADTTKADLLDGDTVRIAALLSTGKDSILATHIMLERNYDLACFITIQSDNQDSYMYHGPNTNLAQLQADAAQTPLITATTQGDKETELDDLKDAIKQAIDEHNIQGIVTGAIESTYQRDRIETICDDLGIKTFNPLWQMDQAQEVKTALDNNIEFIFVKIAAYGLDTTWLGHTIAYDDLKKLQTLHDDLGINIAGEGGEYETFVTNAPFFTHAITIDEATLQKENEHTATLTIHEAHLT
jgi:asparagine synthase (glutamine-hydrolysing)